MKGPDVCFITPIYHVNVNPQTLKFSGSDSLGHISMSTFNWWKPTYKMREGIINIFALFYAPNPDSPYGLVRADECRNSRAVYEEKIKFYTKKYADISIGYKEYNTSWDFNINKY